MRFSFTGDDDVWVFIDNRLALDLGGIHPEQSGSFSVDQVLGAGEIGKNHILRVFYVERHSSASNITIETNIVAPPAGVGISIKDNTGTGGMVDNGSFDKPANDTLMLYSVVASDDGTVLMPGTGYNCNNVVWTIGGKETGRGCEIKIVENTVKDGGYNIEVKYTPPGYDPVYGKTTLVVRAMPPSSVHIQVTSEPKPKGGSLHDDVLFGPGDSILVAYAMLRDKYGNFVGYAGVVYGAGSNDWSSDGGAAVWTVYGKNGAPAVVAKVLPPANGDSTKANGDRDRGSVSVLKMPSGVGARDSIKVEYRICTPRVGGSGMDCGKLLTDAVEVGGKNKGTGAISVNIMNNPFRSDPSGAGRLCVALSLPGTAVKDVRASINIFDREGALVIDTIISAVVAGGLEWRWNGADKKGRLVGTGTYLLKADCNALDYSNGDRMEYSVTRPVGVIRGNGNFTAGSSPIAMFSGNSVGFFWSGGAIKGGSLSVYDASGNIVNKVKIEASPSTGERYPVGSWNLTDTNGRPVGEGSYLVKGVIKTVNGKSEKVTAVLGVVSK
jgi:fibro-slime domain-containing protein